MSRTRDERLLAFLEGELDEREREALLEEVERDPELAAELRHAASGLEAMTRLRELEAPASPRVVEDRRRGPHRVPAWWVAAAAAVTLLLAIPTTWRIATLGQVEGVPAGATPTEIAGPGAGQPVAPDPSFVFVLHGRWPDAAEVNAAEAERRAEEYWRWTTRLAEDEILIAAGDLRWEPGERLGPQGAPVLVSTAEVAEDDFVVGMFAVRAGSYDEALALARECPHLRYGGRVSVRRVGGGFVTTAGFGDW